MPGKSSRSIRIIGGKWRSRLLSFPVADGLRPTGNRIRETLFNWLAPYIEGARCLDLFAGSGALSLEALSRGAASCVAVENSVEVVRQLQANQVLLGAQDLQLITMDCRDYLGSKKIDHAFDVVFIDPPFASDMQESIIQLINHRPWLSDRALIYSELPASSQLQVPPNWQLRKEKQAGAVKYCLYQHIELGN
jgi:16S rRNA (guanine966-N2)-methyltransferase